MQQASAPFDVDAMHPRFIADGIHNKREMQKGFRRKLNHMLPKSRGCDITGLKAIRRNDIGGTISHPSLPTGSHA